MKKDKPYNLKTLLQAVGNDKESLKEMIQIFLDTLPQALAKLRESMEKEDWDAVKRIAHSTKSNIDMLEVQSSFYKIKEIETLAKEQHETEKIPILLEKIEKEMATVYTGLKAESGLL